MKTIPLTPEDDIVAVCDHLDWAHDPRVIFVLPEGGGVLREGLDLVRLRRHADNIRKDIALVTADIEIARQASALGLPVFTTIGAARQGWRARQNRRREIVGLSTIGDDRFIDYEGRARLDAADQQEAHNRLRPVSEHRRWLWRYTAIFLFFVTMALLYVAFLYLLPQATVTLKPEVLPVQVEQPIIADPAAEVVDFQRGILPARLLQTTQTWQADVATTGVIEVPEASARGKVLFANLLAQETIIPAGTQVSTSDGTNRVYQTLVDVTLPGAVGSTVEVEVTVVMFGF